MLEGFLVEELALLRLHRRVTDHASSAADQGDRLVAALLEVLEDHYADKVTDVQGVGCRVDTDISRLRAFHEFFFSSRHDILYHASPFEFLYEILHRMNVFSLWAAKTPQR